MKKWLKTVKNEKGLTLIELLAVVVILGIIAAIAVPSISNIIDNSKKDAHVANALLIINATKLAVVSNDNDVITEAVKDTGVTLEKLVEEKYLDVVPKDPDSDKNPYTSGFVKYDKSTNVYTITLVGSERSITAKTEQVLNNSGREVFDAAATPGTGG